MLGRSYRVVSASVQVDGQIRVTAVFRGRSRALTFWIPASPFVPAPTLERTIDMEALPDTSATRFLVQTAVASVALAIQDGAIPPYLTELYEVEDRFTLLAVRG